MRHSKCNLSAAEMVVRSLPLEALAQIPDFAEVGSRVLAELSSLHQRMAGEVAAVCLHKNPAGHVHLHYLRLPTHPDGGVSLLDVVEG